MAISIREAALADAPAIARVHVSSWRTTYPGIVAQDYIDNLSVEKREQRWAQRLADPCGWHILVAEDDKGGVVGFAAGGPERDGTPAFDSELYAIYLVEQAQRQGIGRRLAKSVTRRLRDQGFRSILVWTLVANPACRFYEALGGRKTAEKVLTLGDEPHDSVAYGWQDIAELAGGE